MVKGWIIMAASLCIHFFGYESARAASMSLFATGSTSLESIVQLTAILGFAASAGTLHVYTVLMRQYGPKMTFLISNLSCTFILLGMFLSTLFSDYIPVRGQTLIIVLFYIFREIYVTLISTQQWSYIISILEKSKSSYIVTIGGCISVASTFGGYLVEYIVHYFGVSGLIFVALSCMIFSAFVGELAFKVQSTPAMTVKVPAHKKQTPDGLSMQNPVKVTIGNDSIGVNLNNKKLMMTQDCSQDKKGKESNSKSRSVWLSSVRLIASHKTLRWLYLEAVAHQSCSNMLNLMFLHGLRVSIPDSASRASLVGKFFAAVNLCSCLLQLFVVPNILAPASVPIVLGLVPILVLLATLAVFMFQSLNSILVCFGLLKVLEYAVMSGAMEMIFMPMNIEIRLVGKEFVRFYGQKGGKSVSSSIIAGLNSYFHLSLIAQSKLFGVLVISWCGIMLMLSSQLNVDELASVHPVDMDVDVNFHSNNVSRTTEGKASGVNNKKGSAKRRRAARIRLDSNASIESLPNDDYFVGEGIAVASDPGTLDTGDDSQTPLPSPMLTCSSDSEAIVDIEDSRSNAFSSGNSDGDGDGDGDGEGEGEGGHQSDPGTGTGTGTGTETTDNHNDDDDEEEEEEAMFSFDELPEGISVANTSESENDHAHDDTLFPHDSCEMLTAKKSKARHRHASSKGTITHNKASAVNNDFKCSDSMNIEYVGVVMMEDEVLSEQILAEIRKRSSSAQSLERFQAEASALSSTYASLNDPNKSSGLRPRCHTTGGSGSGYGYGYGYSELPDVPIRASIGLNVQIPATSSHPEVQKNGYSPMPASTWDIDAGHPPGRPRHASADTAHTKYSKSKYQPFQPTSSSSTSQVRRRRRTSSTSSVDEHAQLLRIGSLDFIHVDNFHLDYGKRPTK